MILLTNLQTRRSGICLDQQLHPLTWPPVHDFLTELSCQSKVIREDLETATNLSVGPTEAKTQVSAGCPLNRHEEDRPIAATGVSIPFSGGFVKPCEFKSKLQQTFPVNVIGLREILN